MEKMNKKISIIVVLLVIAGITTFFLKNQAVTVVKHQTNKVEQGAIAFSGVGC